MRVDPAAVTAAHGRRASSWAVLVDRPTRFVAKVETDDGPVLLKAAADHDIIAREVAGVARLGALGLPVPELLGSGEAPVAYAMLRWTDGAGLTSASPARAQADAGRLLRRVHAAGGDGPYAGTVPTWPEWMAGWLNHAAAWWKSTGRADPATIARLWSWLAQEAELLSTRGRDLMLFDGRPEHFIVDGDRIAVMIDLSEIRAGDAAMDLGVLAVDDPGLLPGVLAGYAPTDAERAAFAALVPFYTTLRRLARAEWFHANGDPADAEPIFALLAAEPPV
ncbi:Ser/Thr protein kinase RdoA (MazF antagonist) [Allocatelliglobosispora scoriae]|uniref:Ser/Thr protein kinase RdoA (MazF antagonist) n=1 Tax=Allocatelliglobosispora scoriae TaxID=643052 RepID=A0A841BPK9_9ACTN|nr:phosphotransferase [Allocatelliglobosispora scoriae]MBB5868883.1 Ser/Thr protein kinase RdoA (MazF antagonist) [Allocatelliglobosispora scoriae]